MSMISTPALRFRYHETCLVLPGSAETFATVPNIEILFKSDDFPTFERPTKATSGKFGSESGQSSGFWRSACACFTDLDAPSWSAFRSKAVNCTFLCPGFGFELSVFAVRIERRRPPFPWKFPSTCFTMSSYGLISLSRSRKVFCRAGPSRGLDALSKRALLAPSRSSSTGAGPLLLPRELDWLSERPRASGSERSIPLALFTSLGSLSQGARASSPRPSTRPRAPRLLAPLAGSTRLEGCPLLMKGLCLSGSSLKGLGARWWPPSWSSAALVLPAEMACRPGKTNPSRHMAPGSAKAAVTPTPAAPAEGTPRRAPDWRARRAISP
mmetsp:Transcript_58816/g.127245  ORF Transcript_58816/g.127245 Transcript_58816/m.127245 type:complete len:326 (+) Transcript_58816:428-1405(+)